MQTCARQVTFYEEFLFFLHQYFFNVFKMRPETPWKLNWPLRNSSTNLPLFTEWQSIFFPRKSCFYPLANQSPCDVKKMEKKKTYVNFRKLSKPTGNYDRHFKAYCPPGFHKYLLQFHEAARPSHTNKGRSPSSYRNPIFRLNRQEKEADTPPRPRSS